jgi:Fur family ferric uptake transcriptional regulator
MLYGIIAILRIAASLDSSAAIAYIVIEIEIQLQLKQMGKKQVLGGQNAFFSFIKGHGFKYTPERNAIVEAITSFKGHFNADELCDKLKERGETISRATVYRSLPLLVKSGIIKETVRSLEKTSYETVFGREHHDHLVCILCGRLIEFKDDEIERMQIRACAKFGFEPIDHWMSIRGYCDACRKKK